MLRKLRPHHDSLRHHFLLLSLTLSLLSSCNTLPISSRVTPMHHHSNDIASWLDDFSCVSLENHWATNPSSPTWEASYDSRVYWSCTILHPTLEHFISFLIQGLKSQFKLQWALCHCPVKVSPVSILTLSVTSNDVLKTNSRSVLHIWPAFHHFVITITPNRKTSRRYKSNVLPHRVNIYDRVNDTGYECKLQRSEQVHQLKNTSKSTPLLERFSQAGLTSKVDCLSEICESDQFRHQIWSRSVGYLSAIMNLLHSDHKHSSPVRLKISAIILFHFRWCCGTQFDECSMRATKSSLIVQSRKLDRRIWIAAWTTWLAYAVSRSD